MKKSSILTFPKAYPIKNQRSEMGAFGGRVVAGMSETRASPANKDLENISTCVGKNEFKAHTIQRQDPSFGFLRGAEPHTDISLACNGSKKSSQPNMKSNLISIDNNCVSVQIENFGESLIGLMVDSKLDFSELDKANTDNVNDSKPLQCHLCGVKVNDPGYSCIKVITTSDYSKRLSLGAIPKLKLADKENKEDDGNWNENYKENLHKGYKGEEKTVQNLVKIYDKTDATLAPQRKPLLKKSEVFNKKENLEVETEKKIDTEGEKTKSNVPVKINVN